MKNLIAIKIASIYFFLGFLWILFSDQFILSFGYNANTITIWQTYKGWFYISVTALLLFFLIRNEIKKKNQIEENLIRAKQKAEESDQLKSAFLANMSHEIRTPLNGILGFCELLIDDSFSQEDKRIFAENLTKNGNDLLQLINDIMDISKIRENQYKISRKNFSLNKLFKSLFDEYQQSELVSTHNKVSLKLICNDDNTETGIFSDPALIMHVFKKLINNAFFFTTEGYIKFGFIETENGIELFVEDTGCGIEETNKEEIFKPFFKGKTPVVGNKGFGLGLAICKGLVKLLDSNLQFKSEVNKGSRFYFIISNQYVKQDKIFLN